MMKRLEHLNISGKVERDGAVWTREESSGGSINVYKYLKGECKEEAARVFSVMPSAQTRGNGHKLKCRSFLPKIRKHLFI